MTQTQNPPSDTAEQPAVTGAPPAAAVVTPAPAAPHRGGAALLVLLGVITTVGPFSFDMYLPAFPDMAVDLHTSPAAVAATLTACLIGMALGQLIFGPLSDRYGRRRPAVVGSVAYTLVSLMCVFAPSIGTLTALRLAQGLAGGAGVVIARAVVRDMFSGAEAARYFSRLTLVFGVAPVIAPTIGAFVLRFTTWRGVFLVLTGIGVVLAVAVARLLPETLPVERRRMGGFGQLREGAKVLFTDRVFLGYTLAGGLSFAGLFAYLSASSFVLQDVFGFSAGTYSVIFGVNSVGLILAGQLNAYLVTRRSPRRLLLTGMSISLTAGVTLVLAASLGAAALLAPMLFFYVAAINMMMPNSAALGLDGHPGMAGTAAALMGALQSMIGSVAGPLTGAGGTSSGLPMTLVMCGFSASALLVVLTLTRTRPATAATAVA